MITDQGTGAMSVGGNFSCTGTKHAGYRESILLRRRSRRVSSNCRVSDATCRLQYPAMPKRIEGWRTRRPRSRHADRLLWERRKAVALFPDRGGRLPRERAVLPRRAMSASASEHQSTRVDESRSLGEKARRQSLYQRYIEHHSLHPQRSGWRCKATVLPCSEYAVPPRPVQLHRK